MAELSALDIFMKHVCPAVGGVIALLMFGSPLKAVFEVNRTKELGEMNPLPYVAMVANCVAWLLYGTLTHDFYVYASNIFGLLLGFFYIFTTYKFAAEKAQDRMRNIFLGFVSFFLIIGIVSLAANMGYAGTKQLWGAACVTVLGVYYVAPLSTVATVLKNRDSSSLHWPLCLMNVINGGLWFSYGLAIFDWFICLPNGIGAGFNILCLLMCFVFPAKARQAKAEGEKAEGFFRRWSSRKMASDAALTGAAANKDADAEKDMETGSRVTNISASARS